MSKEEKHLNDPNPDPIARQERINEVWERRRRGESFALIAEEMSMSSSTAHKLFKEGLFQQAPQGAEEERVLAIQQLDELYYQSMKALDDIVDPLEKLKALAMLNTILKSRRELMGLDAPTKFQGVVHNVDARELELAALIREMEAKDAATEAAVRAGRTPTRRRTR